MIVDLQPLPTTVFIIVMICWLGFTGVFVFRSKPPKTPDRKRDRGSIIGVVLQGVGYALVWSIRRPVFTPVLTNKPLAVALSIFAIFSAIGSVIMVMAAVRTLGKEWSVTARLVEDHKLATRGPYAFVRHPIYTGMLGMLVATGLALSHWAALLAAIVVFFIGTVIRVRSEEDLLR